jgi:hypothetical protein
MEEEIQMQRRPRERPVRDPSDDVHKPEDACSHQELGEAGRVFPEAFRAGFWTFGLQNKRVGVEFL